MKQHLLCFAALFWILFLLIAYAFDLPVFPDRYVKAEEGFLTAREVRLFGKVDDVRYRESGVDLTVKRAEAEAGGRGIPCGGVRVSFRTTKEEFRIGDEVVLSGMLLPFETSPNPGGFDTGRYYKSRGIFFRMNEPSLLFLQKGRGGATRFLREMKDCARARIGEVYRSGTAGILSSLLLGDRSLLSEEERSIFQQSGIFHILAISGLHISLLGMGLFRLLERLRLPLRANAALSFFVMLLYTFFVGCPVSAVRALILFFVLLLAKLLHRGYDPWNAMALAALLILIRDPGELFSSGFQLSFLSASMAVLFSKKGILAFSLLLYLSTLPLILWYFFELPLFAVFFNLLLVPLVPALFLFGLTGLIIGGGFTFFAESLSRGFFALMKLAGSGGGLTLITGRPHPLCILLYAVLLMTGILLFYRIRGRRRFILPALIPLLLLLFFIRHHTFRMTLLSVGQGDGIVIETKEGGSLLVDGGSSSVKEVGRDRILPFLKIRGIRTIDQVLVTHSDEDHISGIRELFSMIAKKETSLRIRMLILPARTKETAAMRELRALAEEAGAAVRSVKAGDRIRNGELVLTVVGPDAEMLRKSGEDGRATEEKENGLSLVTHLQVGSFDALLTGDAEGIGEERIESYFRERDIDLEVLKVAHHGSRNSTPEDLLALLHPKVALVSAGDPERYGHPHDETLARFAALRIPIWNTNDEGALVVETGRDGFVVY